MSPWVVGIAAAIGIVGLLAILYFWILPRTSGEAAATEAPALQTPGAAGSSQSAHPFAKHLEIMGVRVVEEKGGKAKIQFLVVNHSAADLPELKMDLKLRAGDREFFSFPVTVPSIGPYEYREVTTTVATNLKPYELPDWQMIRPEFQLHSD